MSDKSNKISFKNFYVKESYIKFNKLEDLDINVDFKTSGLVLKEKKVFILSIETIITEKDNNLNINLKTDSFFEFFDDNDLDSLIDSFFIVNSPAITFPYIRAYISSLSALSGLTTIILPTLNLSKIGTSLKQNITIKE
jgi:preprotein translocase subunit SecB